MRLIIIILHVVSFGWLHAYAQPCRQEQVKDKQRLDILEGFIFQAQQGKHLTPDKGVVHLYEFTDTLGREVWVLSAHLYDTYKREKQLPRSYYLVGNKHVLTWKEGYKEQPLDSLQIQELLQCIAEAIGNRVGPKPPRETQWVWLTETDENGQPKLDANGNKLKRRVKAKQYYDPGPSPITYQYVFGKDGSVRRQTPLKHLN